MVLLRSAIYGTTAVLEPTPSALTDVTHRLARPDPARPAAGRRPRRPAPRLRASCSAARRADPTLLDARPRRRLAGRADLRAHAGLLGGHRRRARRHRDLRPRRCPALASRSRADGEILVDGPTVAGGGTLRTGDLGRLDERGRLIVAGPQGRHDRHAAARTSMPAEVEAALLAAPRRGRGRRVRPPRPRVGRGRHRPRRPPRARSSRPSCATFAAARLARFKVPKAIELVDALPRNASGKLLRRELR